MSNNYTLSTNFSFFLFLFFTGSFLNAQITLERELIGSATGVPTVISTGGSTQELMIDDSFGETMIGYEDGDIIITVGFQQTETTVGEAPPNLGAEDGAEENLVKATVNAYPNPTIERLTVDLGVYQDKFTELRLISINGKTVQSKPVNGTEQMTFSNLDRLTDGNYFLQGIGKDGKLHQLTKVLIVTDSSN